MKWKSLVITALLALPLMGNMCGGAAAELTLLNDMGSNEEPAHMFVQVMESYSPDNRVEPGGSREVSVPWGRTRQGQVGVEIGRDETMIAETTCTVFRDENTPLVMRVTYDYYDFICVELGVVGEEE